MLELALQFFQKSVHFLELDQTMSSEFLPEEPDSLPRQSDTYIYIFSVVDVWQL